MAKVTDIQDKNGVSREIQDKDLANRTSQSTVASTDYILLEDTDGAYHKIAKASFTEAVRGALGSVINSVAKGTDIAKIPVLDSSNDLGMGTLANVASVLGVVSYKGTITDTSIDTIVEQGNYEIDMLASESPTGTLRGWFLIVTAYNGDIWQIITPNSNTSSGMYYRIKFRGSWTGWTRCDNFECNTPEALASLLGTNGLFSWQSWNNKSTTLLADLPNMKTCVITDGTMQNYTDWPSGVSKLMEATISTYVLGSYGMQLLICTDGQVCLRQMNNSVWGVWKKTQLT